MERDVRRIIEDELRRPTLFKNRESLAPEYVPDALPYRDEELRSLASYFRHLVTDPGSIAQRVLVTGGLGTGKTTLVRMFATGFTHVARERGVSLDYIHVNCYRSRTLFSIVHDAASQLGLTTPSRGFSPREIVDMILSFLEENDRYAIMVLDDFHYFASVVGRESVYFIARMHEAGDGSRRLNLVFISANTSTTGFFDPVTESYLDRHVVRLQPYSSSQLLGILRYRARLAFQDDAYDEEALEFIAEYEGVDKNGEGNARHALTTLLVAGDIAEREGARRLTVEHVRKAISRLSREIERVSDAIRYSPLHELLLLLSIVRLLRRRNVKGVEMGEVEEEYRLLCNTYGETPRRHTQLYEYVRNLRRLGIVDTTVKNVENRGRTTIISIPYGPLEELEKYLDALIWRKKDVEY
ncbi:ORC1-type DNA replication protein [Desulfurococcus mucosus]|uniref:ORC1-type DNA replication protein n=1 Tax=Desulfurococcus mucosus (strain ATCC 35584 / DSM 2162 / JCM 9187 / O7/1) TaxID=765177 RepID=E8R6Z4_DESM0|nr:ORC1-type DNA replication protein [Desulfurococcus mucosus]ADV64427.1 ORC complex protein Cdc6/Orc1 [Desulfurococcus mucosus DSM 2162]